MEKGLLHLYCGDGKGKTTAAAGLALRALGRGKKVTFAQFLKDGISGEIGELKKAGARVISGSPGIKFVFQMNEEEKAETARRNDRILEEAGESGCDVLVLDELCAALSAGLIDRELAQKTVLSRPYGREMVVTGRNPEEWLLRAADYVTEMRNIKHPYESGISAREGIEF